MVQFVKQGTNISQPTAVNQSASGAAVNDKNLSASGAVVAENKTALPVYDQICTIVRNEEIFFCIPEKSFVISFSWHSNYTDKIPEESWQTYHVYTSSTGMIKPGYDRIKDSLLESWLRFADHNELP